MSASGRVSESRRALARRPRRARETLADWLAWAERRYARERVALGQVSGSAHDEALYLILHTMGLPLDSRRGVLRKKPTPREAELLDEVFRRRIGERVPASYLTREAWLGDERFYVDKRVIIPRSYFVELLAEELPRWLPSGRRVTRVADVCTGSGCLAVLVARRFADAIVDAVELSIDALAVARFNVAQHGLGRRIRLHHSDVFDAVPRARYDLIISNPPYVPTRELRRLPEEFRTEPAMAFDGGAEGLDVIRKLVRQSAGRLRPGGLLAIEVGGIRKAVEREFSALEPHWFQTEDGENCVCGIKAERLRQLDRGTPAS